ncbi:MAG: flagellar basal body rod protein FlgB [Thermodesulfobacteriota bacterium]
MIVERMYTQTMQLVEKNLDLRAKRHELLVSNIANMDTPNYKAFDILVDEQMQQPQKSASTVRMGITHPGHLQPRLVVDRNPVVTQAETSEFSFKNDGNTVDMDRTMTNLAENGLLYNASAQVMMKKFRGLAEVIAGAGR